MRNESEYIPENIYLEKDRFVTSARKLKQKDIDFNDGRWVSKEERDDKYEEGLQAQLHVLKRTDENNNG